MKTFDEHMDNIRAKAAKIKRRRRIMASAGAGIMALSLALVLFVPFSNQPPSVAKYRNSPYYDVIKNINKLTYEPPAYKNNFEKLTSPLNMKNSAQKEGVLTGGSLAPTMALATTAPAYGPVDMGYDAGQQYQEVTDNQVQGVIEGDIFKRSDRYIFRLFGSRLYAYSIAQEESKLLGTLELEQSSDTRKYSNHIEFYLSEDCSTVTLLSSCYDKQIGDTLVLTSIDVSDPANMKSTGNVFFPGVYGSSRMVNGQLLLTYNYSFSRSTVDFDEPTTFVPVYGQPEDLQPVGGANIVCPEDASFTTYTAIAKIDGKTMEVMDTAALLGYSRNVYVSQDTIFATYNFTQKAEHENSTYSQTNMTKITGIRYADEKLEILGTIELEGRVKDQYSMDQQGSILRVATSTRETVMQEGKDSDFTWVRQISQRNNCNLYCVDMSDWEVEASVIGFAPDGEEVTSARFDGDKAYICTAEVIIMTDPVYFFDLSDLSNITYKHTPIIDGFSSSLIQFGDYLLGIGYNEYREMKLEAYRETENGVEPIASYERNCNFADVYKAYYIDRENGMIGIGVIDWETGAMNYLLINFDGEQFCVLQQLPVSCPPALIRADVIEGWLYLLHSELTVLPLN